MSRPLISMKMGGSADADVVQPAVVAEGECAAGVDDVAADPGLRLAV